MGGCLLYPHPVLQSRTLSAFSRPRFGTPVFSIKEIRDPFLVSSIRADGNRGRHRKNPYPGRSPKTDGADDNAQSFDGKSSGSPNKEEILALFKRIQSSISKGETLNPKKRVSKVAEDGNKPSAETILGVLQQSRTQRKGKSVPKKDDEFLDALKKEEKEESAPAPAPHLSSRLPSRFTRRSPLRSLSSPREDLPSENERTPATPTLSIQREDDEDEGNQQAIDLAQMKLPQLKEVAKSKGIKGYSKLKKSELLDLLIKSSP